MPDLSLACRLRPFISFHLRFDLCIDSTTGPVFVTIPVVDRPVTGRAMMLGASPKSDTCRRTSAAACGDMATS